MESPKSTALSMPYSGSERELDYNERITELTKFIFEPIRNFTLYENPEHAQSMLLAIEVDGKPYSLDITRYEHLIAALQQELTDNVTRIDGEILSIDKKLIDGLNKIDEDIFSLDKKLSDNVKRIDTDISQLRSDLNAYPTAISLFDLMVQVARQDEEIQEMLDAISLIQKDITQNKSDANSLKSRATILEERVQALELRLSTQESAIARIPVDMIYTQYPMSPDPHALWPGSTWQIVDYAGAFFRSEGGLAAPFEEEAQLDSAPNITGSFTAWTELGNPASGAFTMKSHTLPMATTGAQNKANQRTYSLDASTSAETYGRRNEVAPMNYTIRIWRCTKSNG